jgi:hypothetical protein
MRNDPPRPADCIRTRVDGAGAAVRIIMSGAGRWRSGGFDTKRRKH